MKRVLILLAFLAASAMAANAAGSAKVKGWISDSKCGAMHTGTGAECVRSCIRSGKAVPVFVDEAKKEVWAIDNPSSVKNFYGDHVTVRLIANNAKKSVHIESIAEAH